MKDSYTTADLNPRSAAAVQLRKTVERSIELVKAFDALKPGEDWQDVPGATYRRIIGERYQFNRMLEECWNRYQAGSLFREVADLASNLPPSVKKKLGKQLSEIEGRADVATKRNRRSRRAS